MKRPTTMEDYDLLEKAYGDMMHLPETITKVLNVMSNDTEAADQVAALVFES
jgi:hypothetical protein